MGWWTVENSENVVGDRPLDLLGQAVVAVVSEYQRELGRKPTKDEWEALLYAVLGTDEPGPQPCDEGVVDGVRILVK